MPIPRPPVVADNRTIAEHNTNHNKIDNRPDTAAQLQLEIEILASIRLGVNLFEQLGETIQIRQDKLGNSLEVNRQLTVIVSNWIDSLLHEGVQVFA